MRDATLACLAAKTYATLVCPCLQIGQYSVYNPVSKAFRDDVHMFDMNLDRYTHVSVVDAMEFSQRFNSAPGNGADDQHDLDCDALSNKHNSCWARGEQCHDVFYVGDDSGNPTGDHNDLFDGGARHMQIRHMCGWLKPRGPGANGLSVSNRNKVRSYMLGDAKEMFITEYALAAAENAFHKLQTKEVEGECQTFGSAIYNGTRPAQTVLSGANADRRLKRPEAGKTYTKADFITVYLTTAVTKENFEIMLQNDIPLPISVIMARPFCTYQMGTAILARGGLELGAYRDD